MSERWPESMSFPTAIAYLDLGETKGKRVLDRIPSFQHFTGEPDVDRRSNRYWRRSTLDAYLEQREKVCVGTRKA